MVQTIQMCKDLDVTEKKRKIADLRRLVNDDDDDESCMSVETEESCMSVEDDDDCSECEIKMDEHEQQDSRKIVIDKEKLQFAL